MNISGLAREINRNLAAYSRTLDADVKAAADTTAEEAVASLKPSSPKLTEDYSKGWRVKKEGTKSIVHNATDYQLTHLLENGHAKVGGGFVPPVVHIEPVEQQVINNFIRRVEEAAGG